MKSIALSEEKDGFYGFFKPVNSNAAIILCAEKGLITKAWTKWLNKMEVSVLSVTPNKEINGCHNWPLEHIESAVKFLKEKGYTKIGICGISIGTIIALSAASVLEDITLTIALTPMDYVLWGYVKDGSKEKPVIGESLLTWRNNPLPYVPPPCADPEYWQMIEKESKRRGDMIASKELFDAAEEKHSIEESEWIKVENIRGRLFMAGSEDDVLWNTCRGIKRMKERLEKSNSDCIVEAPIYKHCTHFIFPEGMIKCILPIGIFNFLLPKIFKEAKGYVKECQESRIDIDNRISAMIKEWIK